jgi:hypothetical protein
MHHLLIANDASSNYPVFGYFRLLKNTTIGVLLSLKEIHWTIELLSFKGICCTEVIINFLPSTNFSSSPFLFFFWPLSPSSLNLGMKNDQMNFWTKMKNITICKWSIFFCVLHFCPPVFTFIFPLQFSILTNGIGSKKD